MLCESSCTLNLSKHECIFCFSDKVYNQEEALHLKLTDMVVAYGILEHARLGQETASTEEVTEMAVEGKNEGDTMKKKKSNTLKKCHLPRVHAVLVEKFTYSSLPWIQPKREFF